MNQLSVNQRNRLAALLVGLISLFFCLYYWKTFTPRHLTFSDGAHFAIVGREISQSQGWSDKYSFWSPVSFDHLTQGRKLTPTLLPLTPLTIAGSFFLFGLSDFSAIIPGIFFHLATTILIYLIVRKKNNLKAALITSLIYTTFLPLLDYATSAASEPLFTFLVLLSFYLYSSKKTVLMWLSILAMFLTRQHGFIYALALLITHLLSLPTKKRNRLLVYFILSSPFIYLALFYLTRHSNIYLIDILPIDEFQVLLAGSNISPENSILRSNDSFPTVVYLLQSIKPILSKTFYNTYNLLKFLPKTFPFFTVPLSILGILKTKNYPQLKNYFLLAFIINLLIVAASVPSLRYLHPLTPMLIILAVDFFYSLKIKNQTLIAVLLFLTLPLLTLFLDARFVKNTHNLTQPSIVKTLALNLEQTEPDSVIVTNLDTWGTWFANRTTLWFPISPNQIEEYSNTYNNNPIDYIYITSYKANDPSSLVGDQWVSLIEDKPIIENEYLKQNYEIISTYNYDASSNYENLAVGATLLKIKQ